MRRLLPGLLALAALLAGCGGKFDLPTERRTNAETPTDKSYAVLNTWPHQQGIQDVLLTQGPGSQLFFLYNYGGSAGPSVPRGEVKLFPFSKETPIGPPYFTALRSLFNPVAIAANSTELFVLDQGDSCQARFNALYNTCAAEDTAGGHIAHPNPIRLLSAYWRVRAFDLAGGDTSSTFTDTTVAIVWGIAADDNGHVYVSGIAAVLDTLVTDPRFRTRHFAARVYRYSKGPRYPGVLPYDSNMPGSAWHRDTTWFAIDGTGNGSINDPHGIVLTRGGTRGLFIADRGNDQTKLISTDLINVGFVQMNGYETADRLPFRQPEGVAADLEGFLYVVDRGNQRVLRYDPQGNYVQQVNVPVKDQAPLLDPVAVGVDDTLAYVADRARGWVIRYKRRP